MGQPTPPPARPGYKEERVSTGAEKAWAPIPAPAAAAAAAAAPAAAAAAPAERDATWKSLTKLPLYAEAFGVKVNPNGCHAEEEILAQLTGKRAAHQASGVTRVWTARAEKVDNEKALTLELNAWPCRGSGDPNCHAKLSQYASTKGVKITVKVVGDSGGYESGHREDPNWVAGATKITYTGTTVTYTKA